MNTIYAILGFALTLLPFIAVFVLAAKDMGFRYAALAFLIVFIVFGFFALGVYLLELSGVL